MTINVTQPQETTSLLHLSQRTFYPTKIPQQHHQLKNFISTTEPNVIFFASEHEVYALHISTRKKELIASLPWEPQCLDAGHGWICVGGFDNGRCAFINIDGCTSTGLNGRAAHHHAEVDDLLPLDLDPESRILAPNFLHRSQSSTLFGRRRKPEVQIHEVGDSIVNSVKVHCLLGDKKKGLQDEVLAVLTNNDQTVRIFSLSQSRLLATLHFPTPMNYATISPDGKLLLAVGDEPRAFFCKRVDVSNLGGDGKITYQEYEWREIAEPRLGFADSSDACFSTAFSPSGHVCAVASQTGVITIFDTNLIREEMDVDDAVIDVLRSSRPCVGASGSGAVRSMSFAPAPWDLLAWAEDQGRVCVTDLRNAFQSRQTINLDPDSPNLTRVSMSQLDEDPRTMEQRQLDIEARFAQRYQEALDTHNDTASVSHTADYMELAAERRRLEREAREIGQRDRESSPYALTESERQMLETIRVDRQRANEQVHTETGQYSPVSVNYPQTTSIASSSRQGDTTPQITNPSSTLLSTLQNTRSGSSIHEYMRQRNLERDRTGDRSYQPRRRSSVVITTSNRVNASSSPHPSSLAPIGTATQNLSASPSRLHSSTDSTTPTTSTSVSTPASSSATTDPWQTISEAMASGHLPEIATRLRRERDFAVRQIQHQQHQQTRIERLRLQRQRQSRERTSSARAGDVEGGYEQAELDVLRRLAEGRVRVGDGVTTMGIGWSRDGRSMYVGIEEGIFEFAVNIQNRKTFPGVTMQ